MLFACHTGQSTPVQLLSPVRLFATPWTAARQASLSIANSQSLLKLMSIELVVPFNHLILCHPILCLPSIFPSIRVFSNESALHIRWPNIGASASISVLPMNTRDWSPLVWTGWISLQSKGLSRVFSKPQFKNINLSVLSFLYSPTLTSTHDSWKTIALTRQSFVGKVIYLLFNTLCRLVITFLPRSKHLLISRLQSPSAVILEPPKIKSATVSTVSLCRATQANMKSNELNNHNVYVLEKAYRFTSCLHVLWQKLFKFANIHVLDWGHVIGFWPMGGGCQWCRPVSGVAF